ncbi:MAG: sodium:proton antiporter [Bacteroidetes bacterium]|nr:sodium:proton antiporter [Bacteroidota bacterium]MBS1540300.1 sodium:proton antiporter [Bacteroidota bacterium]
MHDYGLLTLLPVLIIIVLATITRSSFEPLVVGILIGCVIAYHENFLNKFIEHLTTALTDKSSGWVILVCMMYGSLITMMIRGGGTIAFSNFLLKFVKNRRGALLASWVLGILIFVDDYLHSLAVGAAMKKITDKYLISREMLAYIVHATSAPLCILLPITTWSIFISGILEKNNVVPAGQGMYGYMQTMPYMVFGFVGIALVLLVVLGKVPLLGKMKKAEARAATGVTVPPEPSKVVEEAEKELEFVKKSKLSYFLLPLAVLLATTVYFDFDALKGALIANFFTFFYFLVDGALSLRQLSDAILKGFNTILFPIILVILAFAMKLVNDDLHLVPYVIAHVEPYMSRALFPAIAFLTLATIAFLTSTSWDLYVIAIPLIVPLAQDLQVNVWLAVSTVVGAGAFGSGSGFFSDSTILCASSTECPPMVHALSQLPYALMALAVSTVGYVIVGAWMA